MNKKMLVVLIAGVIATEGVFCGSRVANAQTINGISTKYAISHFKNTNKFIKLDLAKYNVIDLKGDYRPSDLYIHLGVTATKKISPYGADLSMYDDDGNKCAVKYFPDARCTGIPLSSIQITKDGSTTLDNKALKENTLYHIVINPGDLGNKQGLIINFKTASLKKAEKAPAIYKGHSRLVKFTGSIDQSPKISIKGVDNLDDLHVKVWQVGAKGKLDTLIADSAIFGVNKNVRDAMFATGKETYTKVYCGLINSSENFIFDIDKSTGILLIPKVPDYNVFKTVCPNINKQNIFRYAIYSGDKLLMCDNFEYYCKETIPKSDPCYMELWYAGFDTI